MPPRSRSHDPTGRPTTPDPINPEAGESESTPKARRRADPQTTPKPRTTAKQRSRSSARTTEDTTADDPSSSPPLLPFSRYDEALPSTLGQLLHMELPPPPLFSDPEVAKTPAETKSMSGAELQVPEDKVLEWIIYAPDLLNNLVAYTKRRIRELKINFSGSRLRRRGFALAFQCRSDTGGVHGERCRRLGLQGAARPRSPHRLSAA